MNRVRRTIAAVTLAGGLALGSFGLSSAASAQVTGGLVNVTITNVLNNNKVAVQIPITAAANVCGVNVTVLAQQLTSGPVTCTSRSGNQTLTISQP
jgi:ABC-type sugar transport system substrate-binding protein